MIVVKDGIIVATVENASEGARSVLKWSLNYQEGKLYINGNQDSITYKSKHKTPDDPNAFDYDEMYREVSRRMVEIASRKGYKFYREI